MIKDTLIGKNDPIPDEYHYYPFECTRTQYGTILRKGNDEIFLQGDDETLFYRACNLAKQRGFGFSYIIDAYFQ